LWHAASAEEEAIYLGAVREGLSDFGNVEGHNITLENRFPGEIPERFMSLAAELAGLNVNILIAMTCLLPTHDATTPVTVISSSPISRNRRSGRPDACA
jgi:putative tryptophan/tyrosine transport system substrate-binding protein